MLALVKDISIILAGAIALVTFVTGTVQYVRQGRQQRATHFLEMRRRFLEDASFRTVLSLLATNDPGLKDVPVQDRRNLVGLLEEVALLVNARLISADVAYYMFGYYVLLIDSCEPFWHGLDRNSEYWTVFRNFAQTMAQHQPGSKSRMAF